MKIIDIVNESVDNDIIKTYNITKRGSGATGLDENTGTWYGWSHRCVCGFTIGDMIFDENYGDDKTPFNKHGNKKIKNLNDARVAAERFADYIS